VHIRNLKVSILASRINEPTTSENSRGSSWEGATLLRKKHSGRIGNVWIMFRTKARILCIDDHWNGLIGRKMLLEQSGYEVLEASGGDEGLKLFRTHAVDAVVLDYQMPGMSGDVVAAKMKRINAHVPIMLLSAYGPLPKSKLSSVDKFLCKSQPPKILLSTLQGLLNSDKPFFYRWLDHWKSRNQGVPQ